MIPPEYRLYAGTMLPGNKTGTIDESYFNQDFKDQVKDQVLSKMDWGMEYDMGKHPKAFPSGTVRKGQILPQDYRTEKNPLGYIAPQYGIGRTNPTGYSSVFNTLGTYDYKYNMPTAPDFSNASIDITDRYDWNPNYGTYGDFTGYIGQGFGREDDEDYVKGTDVDAKMLKEYVFNQIKAGATSAIAASIESGDFDISAAQGGGADLRGDGEYIMKIRRVLPDFLSQTGDARVTLNLKNYPTDAQASSSLGPFTSTTSTTKIDTRARARAISLKVDNTSTGQHWKLGTFRLDIQADGRR